MSLTKSRPRRLRALLHERDLVLLLGAGLVSQTGDWVLATGVGFQVYALTGSAAASAAVLIGSQLPQVLVGSFAGVLVDRWDRRTVMVVVNLALAAVLLPLLQVRDADQVPLVVAVVAAGGCLSPFFTAAEASLLPALVPEDGLLVTANALAGQIRSTARLVGAAGGGVAVGAGGLPLLAVVDLATFVAAAALLIAIRHRPVPVELPRLRPLQDWREGLAVVRGDRALIVLLGFWVLTGLGEGVMGTLFAPFVHDVLRGDGRLYGLVVAAQAVGGMLGGLVVTAFGHRFTPRGLLGVGAVVFGLLDGVLFLYHLALPQAWPAVVVIALVGLPGAAVAAGMLTLFQLETPAGARGRVFGTLTTAQNAAVLAGSGAAGALAAGAGILPIIIVQSAVHLMGGLGVLGALPARPRRAPLTAA